MGDPLAVNPVTANYPIVITVVLSLLGTTILTWCLGETTSMVGIRLIFSGED